MPLTAVATDAEENVRARVGINVPRKSNLEMAKEKLVVELAALAIRIVANEIGVDADVGIGTLESPPDRLDETRLFRAGSTLSTQVLEQSIEVLLLVLILRLLCAQAVLQFTEFGLELGDSPLMVVTSWGSRSSMGMSAIPSSMVQSMEGPGKPT